MTIWFRIALTVCLVAIAAPARSMAAVGVGDRPVGRYATDRILIQLTQPAQERVREWALGLGLAGVRLDIDPTPALGRSFQAEARRWNTSGMRPLYFEEFANPTAAAKYGLDRIYILEVPAGSDTAAMVGAFRDNADVAIAALDPEGTVAEFIPNDPSFGLQWSLRNSGQTGGTPDSDIDASDAWELEAAFGGTVTVAIIDSGVSPHPEFGARLLAGRNTYPLANPNLTTDQCNHGTHVAGIAAATGHNGTGIAGVAWGVNIVPVRVLSGCAGPISALTAGIIWAADNGADLANFSLQYYVIETAEVTALQAAIDYATEQGMLLIAATGNQNQGGAGVIAYPARLRNVVAVGGTEAMDRRATTVTAGWISNFGPQIDVVAPGDDIYSTSNNNGYFYQSGTSMAAPHVTGTAALLKAYNPNLSALDISDILSIAVEDKGPPGWDQEYGYGRINALTALEIAATWPEIQSTPANRAIDARQPTDPLGFESYGWDSVEIVSTADVVAGLTVESIAVEQRGNICSGSLNACAVTNDCPDGQTCNPQEGTPQVLDLVPIDPERATIVLDRRVNLLSWTRIQPAAGSLIRLAYLPADVNANQVSDASDASALLAELPTDEDPEYQTSLPEWSVDLDRSALFTALDLLTCVDLLNGADAHTKWLGKKLEPGIE